MTSPEQFPVPERDPHDDVDEQPRGDMSEQPPAPDDALFPAPPAPADEPSETLPGDQALEAPLTDADVPASPLGLDPDTIMIPDSDRAPGIVGETPVGGRLPPDSGGYALPVPPAEDEAALRDMPTPQDLAAEQPALETPPLPEHEASEPPALAAERVVETVAEPVVEPASETVRSRASDSEAEPAPPAAAGDSAATPPAEPAAPPAPAPAASVARAEDWDEDLSPELAAVLFGAVSVREKAAEVVPGPPETPATPSASVRPAAPAPVRPSAEAPARPAGPVMVTTPGEARSRPLVAGEFTAPAPEATIQGKMRYVRIEEPLRGDRGRRIHETWEFFGPDYPALDGRLVKRMESEEFAYADGSWKLTFRRDYSQGTDERTVRIASDGEYAERTDRIQRRDAMSNKTRREREQAGLRYAAPPAEEKRGFLSSLFGRGDGPQTEGPKSWRPAAEAEMRDARRDGGAAFHYRLFEKP